MERGELFYLRRFDTPMPKVEWTELERVELEKARRDAGADFKLAVHLLSLTVDEPPCCS